VASARFCVQCGQHELTVSQSRVSAQLTSGEAKSARALFNGTCCCGLNPRRKRSQEVPRVDCVAATFQPAGPELATSYRSVDRRFGDACGACRAAWCVHRATMRCAKILLSMFPCSR
jgi:hypothetical protein